MKTFIVMGIFFSILLPSWPLSASFKPPLRSQYFKDRFNQRVEELMKAEFSKPSEEVRSKSELLLKKLRELVDKEIKKI